MAYGTVEEAPLKKRGAVNLEKAKNALMPKPQLKIDGTQEVRVLEVQLSVPDIGYTEMGYFRLDNPKMPMEEQVVLHGILTLVEEQREGVVLYDSEGKNKGREEMKGLAEDLDANLSTDIGPQTLAGYQTLISELQEEIMVSRVKIHNQNEKYKQLREEYSATRMEWLRDIEDKRLQLGLAQRHDLKKAEDIGFVSNEKEEVELEHEVDMETYLMMMKENRRLARETSTLQEKLDETSSKLKDTMERLIIDGQAEPDAPAPAVVLPLPQDAPAVVA